MLVPKGITVPQSGYNEFEEHLDDWYGSEDIDGLEKIDISGGLRLVRFVERKRVGFYLPDGSSFSVPESLLTGKIVKILFSRLVKEYGLEESKELKTPLLVRSNVILYKRLEQIGFDVIRPLLTWLCQRLDRNGNSQENMDYLVGYFYHEALKNKGLDRLDLKLNRNTNYYQQKADKLANLQDGVGEWTLVDLHYHLDGYTYCSLGHRIKWEFVVEESTTKERLSFGSTCIDDFFIVDRKVKGQIQKYKTYILNRLIEYAMQYDLGTMDNVNIDRFVAAFGMYLRDSSTEVENQLQYVMEFVTRGMLIPLSLQREYIKVVSESYALSSIVKLVNLAKGLTNLDECNKIIGLLLLAYGGNLEEYPRPVVKKERGALDDINLYGLKLEDGRSNEVFKGRVSGYVRLRDDFYEDVLNVLKDCKAFSNYVTLVHNLVGNLLRVNEIKDKLKLSISFTNMIQVFGITIVTDESYRSIAEIVFKMNGLTEKDLLTGSKQVKLTATATKMENENAKLTIQALTKLFNKKNLDSDLTLSVYVRDRDYYEDLKPLLDYKITGDRFLQFVNDGIYTGNLKRSILQKFLEEYIGKSLDEVGSEIRQRRVEEAKDNRGNVDYRVNEPKEVKELETGKISEDEWNPWTVDLTVLNEKDFKNAAIKAKQDGTLNGLPAEFFRLMRQIIVDAPKGSPLNDLADEFEYKVLISCLNYKKCSAKQFIYVKKLASKVYKVGKDQVGTGNNLLDIFVNIWFKK